MEGLKRVCLCVSIVALSSVGCAPRAGGSSNSSGGSSSSSGGGSDVKSLLRAYYKAKCAKQERCADVTGKDFVTQSFCELVWFSDVDVLASFRTDWRVNDMHAAQVCLEGWATSSTCGDDNMPACLDGPVTVVNPAGNGEVCHGHSISERTCASGLTCTPRQGVNLCYACQPFVAEGGTCDLWATCLPGLYCTRGNTCAQRKAKDEACEDSYEECRGSLVCAGPTGAYTCQPPRRANESCETAPCLGGLKCSGTSPNKVCDVRPLPGEACTTTEEGACTVAVYCMVPAVGASAGTCVLADQVQSAEGGPCAYSGATGRWRCSHGWYASQDAQGQCTCHAAQGNGANCTSDDQCVSGLCGAAQVCVDKGANGAPCSYSLYGYDCQSSYCGGTGADGGWVCAEIPACQP